MAIIIIVIALIGLMGWALLAATSKSNPEQEQTYDPDRKHSGLLEEE